MATGYIILLPGSATFPDMSASNLAPALSRNKGSDTAPTKHYLSLDFDGAGAVEGAYWNFIMPGDYASGGTIDLLWTTATTTAGNTKWQATVGAVTESDADTVLEHADGAAATVTTAVNTTEASRLIKSQITLTMDSAAALDFIFLRVFRDSGDAADTNATDAKLLAVLFSYTTT